MKSLPWRALVAVVVLPGTIGFLIPLGLIAPRPLTSGLRAVGYAPVTLGGFLLLWCIRDFYATGKGTLAPWDPPRHLVASGPYRVSRNPMYLAVSVLLWGWAIGFHSMALAIYALVVMVAFHLRVVYGEEPWLARTFGVEWTRYKARVPRWLGRPRRPW
jgi:protein-S-isoprenylcysteine O-methyltransferase Ste14